MTRGRQLAFSRTGNVSAATVRFVALLTLAYSSARAEAPDSVKIGFTTTAVSGSAGVLGQHMDARLRLRVDQNSGKLGGLGRLQANVER